MFLDLYWKDKEEHEYKIATLGKENDMYVLKIYELNLKKAIRKGCVGIGNITFLQSVYKSKTLFPFFRERIPAKDSPYIDKILKKLRA